jgi:hypothetical protein
MPFGARRSRCSKTRSYSVGVIRAGWILRSDEADQGALSEIYLSAEARFRNRPSDPSPVSRRSQVGAIGTALALNIQTPGEPEFSPLSLAIVPKNTQRPSGLKVLIHRSNVAVSS